MRYYLICAMCTIIQFYFLHIKIIIVIKIPPPPPHTQIWKGIGKVINIKLELYLKGHLLTVGETVLKIIKPVSGGLKKFFAYKYICGPFESMKDIFLFWK